MKGTKACALHPCQEDPVNIFKRVIVAKLTFFICAFGLFPSVSSAEIRLVFGAYAADKPTETVRKFKPFLDQLSVDMTERLGEPVTVKMRIAKEYDEGIRHLAEGEVDFARFGPASYVLAKDLNPEINILAMELSKGQKTFKGIIAVHETSDLTDLAQLEGQTFAFGDELSTIGRYLSQSHLIEAGITSESLRNYEFLGRHDLVGTAVGAGDFTAGALKEGTFKSLVADGVPIRALYEFDNVTKPWLSHSSMPAEIFDAMQAALLAQQDEAALKAIAKDGLTVGTDADYDFVRRGMASSANF